MELYIGSASGKRMSNRRLHYNRRQSSSQGRLVSGTIVYDGNADISGGIMICIVLDISHDGAKLEPVDVLRCPNKFSLKVAGQPARDCKVIWRRGSQIGVKFEPAQTQRPERSQGSKTPHRGNHND